MKCLFWVRHSSDCFNLVLCFQGQQAAWCVRDLLSVPVYVWRMGELCLLADRERTSIMSTCGDQLPPHNLLQRFVVMDDGLSMIVVLDYVCQSNTLGRLGM